MFRNAVRALVVSLVTLSGAFVFAEDAPRNVILYVTDDQGMNDAGCYGHTWLRTPGLDDLAANGVRFTSAFATTPSCSASRSVILTGLYNHANGMYGLQHRDHHFSSFDGIRSLPARLSEAGYRTRVSGKYHVAPQEVYPFDEMRPVRTPIEMADDCRDLIAADDARPFFLYFCTTEPHRPFRREGSTPVSPGDVVVPDYLPDTPESREELAQYAMSLERADSGLVRLLAILRETGHWDDTLVIFLSDNGIPFPGAKTNLYEPGVRLPFVVRNPRANTARTVTDAMIAYTDITPTILDYAGVAFDPGDFHGRSFLGVTRGEPATDRDEVFLSHTFHEITMYYPMRAIRDRHYKLIWNIAHGLPFPFASDLYGSTTWQGVLERGDERYGLRTVDALINRPAFELYDLEADPGETRNLANDEAHAATLHALQAKLRQYQEQTADPWILKWDRE